MQYFQVKEGSPLLLVCWNSARERVVVNPLLFAWRARCPLSWKKLVDRVQRREYSVQLEIRLFPAIIISIISSWYELLNSAKKKNIIFEDFIKTTSSLRNCEFLWLKSLGGYRPWRYGRYNYVAHDQREYIFRFMWRYKKSNSNLRLSILWMAGARYMARYDYMSNSAIINQQTRRCQIIDAFLICKKYSCTIIFSEVINEYILCGTIFFRNIWDIRLEKCFPTESRAYGRTLLRIIERII